jgi:hypothetical protein
MSTGIRVVDRIVTAIAIQVQAVDGFGIQVGSVVGTDKSAPFWGVIPGVAVVQTGIIRTILATRTKRGALATAASVLLFYHLPHPQSRKSHPGRDDLGG